MSAKLGSEIVFTFQYKTAEVWQIYDLILHIATI